MAIGTQKNSLKNACSWPPQKSHHNLEIFLKECPFIFVGRIQRKNPSSLKNALWFWDGHENQASKPTHPTLCAISCMEKWVPQEHLLKKCLFKSCKLIGFHEDVSLKNDDWFLKTTWKPTICFFKECQKCLLLQNASSRPVKNTTKWPPKPIF